MNGTEKITSRSFLVLDDLLLSTPLSEEEKKILASNRHKWILTQLTPSLQPEIDVKQKIYPLSPPEKSSLEL